MTNFEYRFMKSANTFVMRHCSAGRASWCRPSVFPAILALGISAGCLTVARADQAEPPAGFEALFNGRDLSGWQGYNGNTDGWEVQNGLLRTLGQTKGWLLTTKEYSDFEFRVEYRLGTGANSGLGLRGVPKGATVSPGLEVQILDDPAYPNLRPTQYTGAIYNVVPRRMAAGRPAGEWNEMRVTADGPHVRVMINNAIVLEADLDEYRSQWAHASGPVRPRGCIGLQSWGGLVEFRNLFIKPLDKVEVVASGTSGVLGSIAAPEGERHDKPMLMLDAGGHTSRVGTVLFTPEGRRLISVSQDKTIRIWNVQTGEMLQVLRPPIYPGGSGIADLSPDGSTLAFAGHGPETGTNYWIYLIDLVSGRISRVLKGHSNNILKISFSRDGQWIASGSEDRTALIYRTETGKCEHVLRGHTHWVTGVAFSPDGRHLATSSHDESARVWTVATGQLDTILKEENSRLFAVTSVAWSPDGETIATGGMDSQVRLWGADGTAKKRYRQIDIVRSVRFSADSREVLFTGQECGLLDVETGTVRVKFQNLSKGEYVPAATFSPDGKLMATGGNGEVFLWSTTDGALVRRLAGRGQAMYGAGWSPDGSLIAWGTTPHPSAGTSKRWAKGEGRNEIMNAPHTLQRTFDISHLEFSGTPDDKFVRFKPSPSDLAVFKVINKGFVNIVIQDSGQTITTLPGAYYSSSFTFTTDDQIVMGGPVLLLFNARTGQLLRKFQGHAGSITAVASSPDDRYLLTSSRDETLRVWRRDREDPLVSLFIAGNDWIAWTPEGYYAASPGGESLMGWHVNNGPEQMASFYPAAQFRKTFYRPDVIKRLLAEGSLEKALLAADQERGIQGTQTEVAEVLPPKVAITSPAGSSLHLTEARLQVEGSARSTGSNPVTSLQFLLDGRPAPGLDSLKTIPDPKLGEVTASWTVELPPGAHRLAVKATSSVSDALSGECEVTFAPGGSTSIKPAGRLFVLAVGINAYPGRLHLDCAAPDARALAAAFREHSQSLFTTVEARLLVDEQATRRNILSGLTWLKTQVKPGDVAIAFYAGHGDARRAGQFYLLPVDVDIRDLAATGISGDQLKKQLGDLPCSTMLLLDACYAGSFDKPGVKKRALPGAADDLVRDFVYDAGLVVMCAAAKEQEAAEENGRGFFTRAMVEGLSGKAGCDEDGVVDLSALQLYVERRVRKLSGGEQEPTISRPSTVRSFALAKP